MTLAQAYSHDSLIPTSLKQKTATVLLAIVITYNSGSVLMTVNSRIGLLLLMISLLFLIIEKAKKSRQKTDKRLFKYYALLVVMCISSVIANFNFSYLATNIRLLVIVSFSFLFSQLIPFHVFIDRYLKVARVISCLAIASFVFLNLYNGRLPFPVIQNINGVKYYNGILFYAYTYARDRNIGVFWEPGILASQMALALVFELSIKNGRRSWVNIVLFITCLLTTQSTGGYFVLCLALMLFFLKKTTTIRRLVIFSGTIAVTLFVYINFGTILQKLVELNPRVFIKLALGGENASVAHRIGSPIINMQIFFRNPIFGIGLGKVDVEYANFARISQTSTSTYFLAAFGIMGALYTVMVAAAVFRQNIDIISKPVIALIILFIVNKEPHTYFVLTYLLLFYLLSNITKPRPTTTRPQPNGI